MAMAAAEIEALIKAALPDASVRSKTSPGTATTMPPPSSLNVSAALPRVRQHQMVYAALSGRMGGALHALALQTSAPE